MPANNSTKTNPCLIVIFGASGDLTERKLIPSLYALHRGGQLPLQCAILGVSRTKFTDEAFRDHLVDSVRQRVADFDDRAWSGFARRLHYYTADPTQVDVYPNLKKHIAALADQHGSGDNVLFYLSLAPHLYEPVINHIGAAGMVTEGKAWCSLDRENRSWQRIVVEKPFGHDPDSAAHLNRVLGRTFEDEAIYRIDHYLGKEIVQNLMVFRFANSIFEPVWNRQYVDHVQVTAAETVGVEGRGGYYDSPSGGAMRDMIQSHLLQVMALVAMEPPVSMAADAVRGEHAKVLRAVDTPVPPQVSEIAVRGQYGPGQLDGKAVPGYREEEGVDPQSQTDTYAALRVNIDNWRWQGVPFYLRSGKRMARKTTEIVITFKPTPHCLFRERTRGRHCLPPNQIVINVQPDEGIRLRFEGKVPGIEAGSGAGPDIKSVIMDFDYIEQFQASPSEAYTTLLLDALRGDQTLFKGRHEIEHAWRIVQPVLDYWSENPGRDLPNYAAGTWGPSDADVMLAKAGRHWRNERGPDHGA